MKLGVIRIYNFALCMFCCLIVLWPNYSFAGSVSIPGFYGSVIKPPTPNTLPVLKNPTVPVPGVSGVSVENSDGQNQLIVHQNQQNAIIDWASFNIGANAGTQFDQKGNANWVALNRIWDLNPSLIFGKLTADGKIYLINQNGILFGTGSRINVKSLTASALNMKNIDFLKGLNNFYIEEGATNDQDALGNPYSYRGITFHADSGGNPDAVISNYGEINTSTGGTVFLLGPRVENFGIINAPLGQVGLAAGTRAAVETDTSGNRAALVVDLQDTGASIGDLGTAWNREGGQLLSEAGMVGIYGRIVNQDGLIRAVTAVKQGGQIELRASEKITTGLNSKTESPISNSSETADSSFTLFGGQVSLGALQTVFVDATGSTTVKTYAPPAIIALQGSIDAPAGQVSLTAGQRVNMEMGSSINVGGVWSNESVTENLVDAQLNSVELKDAYGQKGGMLQGQKIYVNGLTGSSIGDVSGAFITRPQTALEKGIKGGTVELTVDNGDIIVEKGATLDFSGGGINYAGDMVNSTKLLSGTKIYDISNAPLTILYDDIMGTYTKTYVRYGLKESFSGIYYGGASALMTYVDGFKKGGDAGLLTLAAGTVVLDGRLNGSVTQGLFQKTLTSASTTDYEDALQLSKDRGLEIPVAGWLTIGTSDNPVYAITLLPDTSLSGYDIDSAPLTNQQTFLSAKTLSDAKLGKLDLTAATTLTTVKNADLVLSPGASFTAMAGRIEHYGEVIAPAGAIKLMTWDKDNGKTADKEIFLGYGSVLDVSGQKVDNFLFGTVLGTPVNSGELQGGTIALEDQAVLGRGVFVSSGATLDVSGGYRIDPKGKVTGGDAGTLQVGGNNIMLSGDMRGYSLADSQGKIKGGQIMIEALNVEVTDAPSVFWPNGFTADSRVPYDLEGRLIIAGDLFADTGFTRIELDSFHGITVEGSTVLAPSFIKLKYPSSGAIQDENMPMAASSAFFEPVPGHNDLVKLDSQVAYRTGPSSFTAKAGKLLTWQDQTLQTDNNATLTVSQGAVIRMAPEGKMDVSAANDITIAGTLESLSGQISITAGTGGQSDLVVTGDILAMGYNRLDGPSAVPGFGYNYTPRDAGKVTLTARGDLLLQGGSLVDISGSRVIEKWASAGGELVTFRGAGNPGSLSLSYLGALNWDGSVDVHANIAGLQGGSLTVSRTDAGKGMDVTAEDIVRYSEEGFDALTLKSVSSLNFSGPMDVTIGRQLTLDAPLISGAGQDVTLRSPWITLENTSDTPSSGLPRPGENGQFSLASTGWIDIIGSIDINGFQGMSLKAFRDIRLTDFLYAQEQKWKGQLSMAGDLLMKGDRIYPTIQLYGGVYSCSNYTMQSGTLNLDGTVAVNGKVTILGADFPVGGNIFSAGGNLTISASGGIDIEKGATLAAPMGIITLNGTGPDSRVYLADGSVVTTAGNAMVNVGSIDIANGTAWTATDHGSNSYIPMTAPGKAVNIEAPEVIVRSGANVDTSGGGSLFAYQWQPGIEGLKDPLKTNGTDPYTIIRPDGNYAFVIIPDHSVQLPGKAVYLEAGGGLKAGFYSILPVQDAFLPGAIIIEQQKLQIVSGGNLTTEDGYPVIAGHWAVYGTDIQSAWPTAFSVMKASEILGVTYGKNGLPQFTSTNLTQGNYTFTALEAGDGGNLTVKGKSVIIDGLISAAALSGYKGGTIGLSAKDIQIRQTAAPLGTGLDFDTLLGPALKGKLIVAASTLSGKGFQEIDIGDQDATNSVTVQGGSLLTASVISLGADKTIAIESGAELLATGGTGRIELATHGDLSIEQNALLHASNDIALDVNNVQDIKGNLRSDSGALTLKSSEIFFGSGAKESGDVGLYLTGAELAKFSGFSDITFASKSDIQFREDFTLTAADSLTLDAANIFGMNDKGVVVGLNAPTVSLRNSAAASHIPTPANSGTFTVKAGLINVGTGDVLFGGFKDINLNSQNDLTLKGKGSLNTGGAGLKISAARVTTAPDQDLIGTYVVADFAVDAGTGSLNIVSDGVSRGPLSVSGGSLEFTARTIDVSGVVEVTAGRIQMTGTGPGQNNGIFLHNGGQLLARGTDVAPGGRVTLYADEGSLSLGEGSLIDVSAGYTVQSDGSKISQGDAGLISLTAPVQGVIMKGNIWGTAQNNPLGQNGTGGSFTIDTLQLSDAEITKLIKTLVTGGFSGSLDLRTRSNNIVIEPGQTLAANHIKLTADDQSSGSGQINVYGTIDASASQEAGTVELYANNDLNIWGTIFAGGTDKGEEDIILSSAHGFVDLQASGMIDVSGKGTGQGVVHLRAQQYDADLDGNNDDVKMALKGTIKGASAVYAEAFRIYDDVSTIDQSKITTWQSEAQSFMANSSAITLRLNKTGIPLHLLPGIEVRNSNGEINLGTKLDFNAWSEADGINAGVLTIRAAGDLNISNDLLDAPTNIYSLLSSPVRDSWAFNLTAGADVTAGTDAWSADYMAVITGRTASDGKALGNLTIADQKLVYTESGPVRFASGGDTVIGRGQDQVLAYMVDFSMRYNLASFDGQIQGHVGNDLKITGGAIQTATGDIDLSVGSDLVLSNSRVGNFDTLGSIRTTGQTTAFNISEGRPDLAKYWTYAGGGNIRLDVGGNVGKYIDGVGWVSALSPNAWDMAYQNGGTTYWAANYERTGGKDPTAGLSTMGGGDLVVLTGGDFLAQAGAFGQNKADNGDLIIYSNGDIQGRFLNNHGKAEIHAAGNFGAVGAEQQIEAFDSRINVSAGGGIVIGAVVNPTIASDSFAGLSTSSNWYLTYTTNTSLKLKAAGGDVVMSGKSQFYNNTISNKYILPATVDIEAEGDIRLMNTFALTPSFDGNLVLIAGGSIIGGDNTNNRAAIYVSDMDPGSVYGMHVAGAKTINGQLFDTDQAAPHGTIYDPDTKGYVPLHGKDSEPIKIQASDGDIENLELFLPKKALITAKRDIRDIFYYGQNINADDVSEIRAGRDITFTYGADADKTGMKQAGPGLLLVEAGHSIDLGSSGGMQAIGDFYNPALGVQGSDIIVLSGYTCDMTITEAGVFFDELRKQGEAYSGAMAAGNKDKASHIIRMVRDETIIPLLGPSSGGGGDINMTSSQISTVSAQSDIFVFAKGELNVGKSAFLSDPSTVRNTGITTASGGTINVFTNKDLNVNESRVMSFFGGDITVWSDSGDINAGRGSKTQVSASPPRLVWDADTKQFVTKWDPPAVGSGLRAVTYDPDGLSGPQSAPPAGDIYLFAAKGKIDAGEAGITGGKVILGATQVVNVQNISFSSGSIGVPSATAGTAGIGTLSGSGSVTQVSNAFSDVAGIGAATAEQASQMVENIMAKWLDVKVIDFVIDDNTDNNTDNKRRNKGIT